ncbi:thiamine pyrophosphate-dependent enzyme [Thermocatellispora tengchongensis]|uniref:thiamine pyrophosphate-dependent enzyme n=1 Tax=Thermocatellispora tengchongensis TaxID=1073253 RepID=UPI00363E96D7
MATGWAIARERPAPALLHTTAGLGNAVGALATARVNRAPLVVLVGQQDRRHLALEPFLAGRLDGLAGEYPVWTAQPARAADLPGLIARAYHEAWTHRGPALVVAPMNDWTEPYDAPEVAAPERVVRPTPVLDEDVAGLMASLLEARAPALVVGARAATAETWAALVEIAEKLNCPVWQESFGARAGFPQDHPLFAGFLPSGRAGLRRALAPYDVVVAVGAPVFRQYGYEPGPLTEPGTALAVVTDDPDEAHRSPVALALLASPAAVCARLAALLPGPRTRPAPRPPLPPLAPGPGEPLRAAHVLRALADRLPADAILIEETPSSRPDLHRLVPARTPLGFVSAAMGGLGFALPAAIGLRMAEPDRPVVAVTGDGAALYGIQSLWSAAHYRIGALFVVLSNGRYAVMDRLAESGGAGKAPGRRSPRSACTPWPPAWAARRAG